MVVLNPLVLVFPNGDCLPFHRSARYARYTYDSYGRYGPVSLQQNNVWKTMTGCIPALLRYSGFALCCSLWTGA